MSPATVFPTPSPTQRPTGRPANSHGAYYQAMKRAAERQTQARNELLCDPLLRLSEIAIMLAQSESSVRRLIKSGLLKASKTTPRTGHWRSRLSEVKRYAGANL